MENKNSFAPAPRGVAGEDVTTWALPEWDHKEKRDFFLILMYAIISIHKTDAVRLNNHCAQ